MIMKKTTIAGLIGLLLANQASAELSLNAGKVVVTANRFVGNSASNPSIRIITQEYLKNSPSMTLADFLGGQAGINIKTTNGNSGIDAVVDMRGFGDAAIGNTLILINGQRLNSPDSSNIQWANIPLSSIERVEIMPGDGTVMFGDRATGGVINIITDTSGKSKLSTSASIGSFGYKSLGLSTSGSFNQNGYFNSFLHTADENGYRQNSGQTTYSLNGSVGVKEQSNNTFLDYSIFHVKTGMPGSITKAQFEQDPRRSQYPNSMNQQTKEGFRVRPGFTYQINPELQLSTDASFSFERQHSEFPDYDVFYSASRQGRDITSYSFNPKLKWNAAFAGIPNSLVLGIDFYKGNFDGQTNGILNNAGANDYKSRASQETKSIYLQNITTISPSLDAVVGFRSEDLKQKASQDAYCSVVGTTLPTCTIPFDHGDGYGLYADGSPSVDGKSKTTKNAYQLGLNYHEGNWGGYVKHGTSFRFSNLDELFGFNDQSLPVFYGNMLKPQTGRNNEIGVNYSDSRIQIKVAVYQSELKDEIVYNNYLRINTNLDATERRGIETQLAYQVSENLKTKLSYTHAESTLTTGSFKGNDIPGVPNDVANLQLIFNGNNYGKYLAKVNYVGPSYFSNDFKNEGDTQNSYTTLDIKASWELSPFTLDITALNVLDKNYFNYGIKGSSSSSYVVYPANGQSIYASLKYDFK